jgi:hypothetical protein
MTATIRRQERPKVLTIEETLPLAKTTRFQWLLTYVYIGVGSVAFSGIVTAIVVLLAQGRYRFGSFVFSLNNLYQNWPILGQVPARLSTIHFGGTGGLGSWFVGLWPAIQHIYLFSWPIGVVAVAGINLLLNRSVGKKENWVDRRLHDIYQLHLGKFRPFAFVNSRLQMTPTTRLQYGMLWLTMLVAGLPGAIGISVIMFGWIAVMHSITVPHGIAWLVDSITAVFQNNLAEVALLGIFSHRFFASRVTMQPAFQTQRRFLARRLSMYDVARQAALTEARRIAQLATTGGLDEAAIVAIARTTAETATKSGRNIRPGWWYAPNFVRLFDALVDLLWSNGIMVPTYVAPSWRARLGYIATAGLILFLALYGVYCKFWLPSHGGLVL